MLYCLRVKCWLLTDSSRTVFRFLLFFLRGLDGVCNKKERVLRGVFFVLPKKKKKDKSSGILSPAPSIRFNALF